MSCLIEFQNISALLYQKNPDSRDPSSNKTRKSQDPKPKNRMPPRNNSFRYLVGKENSQKSLSRIQPVEYSIKTNKEEILNSISINAAKENKSSLQQKLDILGKILSKGRDSVGPTRKKSENFSNYSSLFYQNTSNNNISKDGIQVY